jgi:ubiquinone/menaquinone biosynthesis C-methylase UbiE
LEPYPLGYSEAEARRLEAQGAVYKDLTEDLLRGAGLCAGMHVLDVGCGVGDVSLLAAGLVGENGSVLGIDRASSSLETARRRAKFYGVTHATFVEGDLTTFEPNQMFDMLVGRLVLLYIPDPASAVRRLSRFVRPGGVVAFHEFDMSQTAQEPESPLFKQAKRWILEAFGAAGAEANMGAKLYRTYLRAGLPHPAMISAAPVQVGPESPGYGIMAQVVRSLLPVIERHATATAAEIDIDTLADRLRDDALANERVAFMPRVVGAWARVGSVRAPVAP